MSNQSDYLVDRLRNLDDEAFVEVIGGVTERAAKTEVKRNDDIVHISEIEDQIEKVYENWGKVSGLSTGYPRLDDKTGGLGKGHVVLIGGETSNGKSALATNIAVNVAKQRGVLYITLEMLQEDIGARIKHVNNGTVQGLDLMFQSEFRMTYKDVEPTIKKAQDMGNVEVVVLDYLQYLGRGMKMEEVAVMSKEMKTLALKYQIPFVIIVSLRKAEQGKGKRKWTDIEVEDLMGTGSIGYDADTVLIASRKDMDNQFDTSHIWVKVVKTRNHALNYTDRFLFFDWDSTRITEPPSDIFPTNDGFKEA